jgi:hypothetical protein
VPSPSQTSSALRSFAEEPAAWGELDPDGGYERVLTERYCLLWASDGPFTQVSRLRLDPDDVAETLHEVRAEAARQGRRRVTWNVSSRATPADLVDRLVGHGLVADDHQTSLVLEAEPPAVGGVTVRRAEGPDELRVAAQVAASVFGDDPGPPTRDMRVYLAFADGRAVGAARMLLEAGFPGGLMIGGSVLADARGRGAYRALVRARWEDAAGEGFAGLCVQAGSLSRPILERLGFEVVAEHEILGDPATC